MLVQTCWCFDLTSLETICWTWLYVVSLLFSMHHRWLLVLDAALGLHIFPAFLCPSSCSIHPIHQPPAIATVPDPSLSQSLHITSPNHKVPSHPIFHFPPLFASRNRTFFFTAHPKHHSSASILILTLNQLQHPWRFVCMYVWVDAAYQQDRT